MQQAEEAAQQIALQNQLSAEEAQNLEASLKMENSFAGQLGHFIEPAIRPLGYDWKIGIALLTSFAAREVFVGTMSTLYSIGTEANEATLTEKLRAEKAADGSPMFTVALAVSLALFYAFAMQCMSTVAVVRRETGSWKWPLIQLVYMTSLAYISSFMAFQLLS
jgi:ferrous iron transport protein B